MSSASGRTLPKCPACGSVEIDFDPARGDAACVDCGTVVEENAIVAEVGFAEDARGRSSVVGQHVRADGRPNTYGVLPGFSREATEITMANGRRRLGHLVSALRLNTRHTDAAVRLFRLAVERNFHKGRRMANVCCACLYVVCRIERTPHMLLDFSDVLETNVYVLGNTFLKFAQILSIELPIIDPSLYIHRFASKLEFGDKTHGVAMSALRLLARMRRDWMSYGRRPSGLCGAALIIAARMHNFYRSQADVVRVVRIGNVALRERLQELDRTPTAALTAAQIDAGGGDDGKEASLTASDEATAVACDPPAFQRLAAAKRREEEAVKEREKQKEKDTATSTAGTANLTPGPSSSAAEPMGVRITPARSGRTAADEELEEELNQALASRELQELERESNEEEEANAAARAGSVRGASNSRQGSADGQPSKDGLAGAEATGNKDTDGNADKDDGELSDLDDDDVAKYLNTDEEYEHKKELWMEMNKEYLEQQERLEKMKAERPEEYKRLRPWRASKKRKAASLAAPKPTETPAEAAQGVVSRRASKKLNYSVLESLGRSGTFGNTGTSRSATGVRPSGVSAALPPRPPPAGS